MPTFWRPNGISNLSLVAVVAALAITIATIVAAWAFKEHIGQTEVQVMDVSVACVTMNSTLYIREVEVRLIYDLVLGRVWSQTITPETLRHKKQHEVIQQCIGAPLSVTHTGMFSVPSSDAATVPHVWTGYRTGAAISRPTEGLLSSFILWRLQHWILGVIADNEATLQQAQPTYSIFRHAYSYKHCHEVMVRNKRYYCAVLRRTVYGLYVTCKL